MFRLVFQVSTAKTLSLGLLVHHSLPNIPNRYEYFSKIYSIKQEDMKLAIQKQMIQKKGTEKTKSTGNLTSYSHSFGAERAPKAATKSFLHSKLIDLLHRMKPLRLKI